jgi:hypothetical protein
VQASAAQADFPALPLRLAVADLAGVESPARRLQHDLERHWEAVGEPRWSARRTLAFVVLTNGTFWAALIYGLRTFA